MPRASRRRGEAAKGHADTVRFVLFAARPAGLLFHQLTRADGYRLGAEQAALEAYERAEVNEKLTEFRRFVTGTVAPHATAHPSDKWVRHIVARLNSIESTLDLISTA